MLSHEAVTRQIIAAAINVHRTLGPGYIESIYENALVLEMEAMNLRVERQRIVPIFFRHKTVGQHRVDLLVEGQIVIELKAVSDLAPVFFAVVRSYLKALDLEVGLLLNFAAIPLTIKRVGREWTGEVRPVRGSLSIQT